MRLHPYSALTLLAGLALSACAPEQSNTLSIDYDSYTLDNGLKVILHEGRSDPIAAVAILYGSERVVQPALVVRFVDRGFHLLDQVVFFELRQRPIEHRGPETDMTVGLVEHGSLDRVPVQILAGQSQEDLEPLRLERPGDHLHSCLIDTTWY